MIVGGAGGEGILWKVESSFCPIFFNSISAFWGFVVILHSNCTINKIISQKIFLGQNKNKYTNASKHVKNSACAQLTEESQEVLPVHLSRLAIHLGSSLCGKQLLFVPYDILQLETAVLSNKLVSVSLPETKSQNILVVYVIG